MIVVKFILFMLLFSVHHCRLPDKVSCVNEQCNEPISKARTIINYNSGDKDLMSFRGNAEALIFMKSAGTNPDLWYAKIDGKSGFVSSRFLRENKIYVKDPVHILPVQVKKKSEVQPELQSEVQPELQSEVKPEVQAEVKPEVKPEVQPDKVQQAHEVVEGTTIYSTESAISDNVPDATVATPTTLPSEETTPSISSQEPANKVINQNVWSQIAENQPVSAGNGEAGITTPSPTEPQPIQESNTVPEATQNHINVPIHESLPKTEESISNKEGNMDISTQTSESKSTENFNQNVNVETMNQNLSPAPETLPLAELYTSGEMVNTQLYDVHKQVDVTQQTLPQTKSTDNLESNISIPINNVEIEAKVETPSNVPDNVPSQSDHLLPQFDSTVYGSVFSQDVNGEVRREIGEVQPDTFSADVPNPQEIPLMDNTPASTESNPVLTEAHLIGNSDPSTIWTTLPPIDSATITETPMQAFSHESGDLYDKKTEATANQETLDFSYSNEMPMNNEYSPDYSQDASRRDDYITPESQDAQSSEDNSDGIISSLFTSVSNIWESTTPVPAEDNTVWEANIAPPPAQEPEQGFSFFGYLFSTYNSIMGTQEQSKALFASTGETCYTDDNCDVSDGGTLQSNRLLTFLLTSASAVLFFTLGYYYLDNTRQDSKLIGNINSLQRDLLFTTKECEILKEELTTTKNKLARIEDSSFGMDDMVLSLKEEINELKAQNERLRHSLDDNEKLLRVSENTAGELQNTLGEVENTLSELLGERANSEEHIAELNGKIQAFEEELISVSRDRDNFQLKYVSAETALEESKKQIKLLDQLNEKLKEANNTIQLQKHEITALKDALKELKNGHFPNMDAGALIDHTEIKAKLAKALEEKKSFESKYEVEYKERSRLAEELESAQETLRTTSQQATEASTRLEVLGKYFQEREGELLKELNSKESLYLSKQGESASTVEKMELLQQEIQRYKEKCDALTLELAEQESTRRSAISEVEARAHQAWLEARGARRDADAARDDAAALRRKLAALTAADGASSPHRQVSSPLENVDGSVVPPPLPPLAFLPPPLLPPLPRPPPLGRLPSPHPPRYNERRYSPDSRYSPESRYSPDTVRYSPDSRYSPRRRSPYSPRRRYNDGRGSRSRNGPPDTETEYNSDSPSRDRRRPPRYSRHSGPSSGSGCSSESDK